MPILSGTVGFDLFSQFLDTTLGFRILASACLGLLLLLVATARPAAAQDEVSAYSKLAVFPDPPTIVAYSITEINAAAAADGYTPDIAARLEADGTVVAEADPDTNDPGNSLVAGTLKNGNTTECQLDQGAVLGACVALEIYPQQADVSTYVLVGYHYLLAPEIEETGCYDDSAGFGLDPGEDFMPGDSDPGEGDWEGPGGGDVCLTEVEAEIYLGYSTDQFSGTAPTINSISPTGASLGSSGTITVDGQNLETEYDGDEPPTVAITGSGITVSVATSPAPTAQEVTVNYSITANASTGPQNLTLTTLFGASNAAQFTIGDPTPAINSVTPSPWNVGSTNAPFTINGTGFGTSPTVTINGTGLTSYSITSTADTQINGTFTIDPNAPSGSATVQVQSNGYGGSGFLQSTSGQPSQSSAYSVPIAALTPQIMWGTDCSSATPLTTANLSPTVGQQIALVGCLMSAGVAVATPPANPSWAFTGDPWISGGYSASTSSGQEAAAPATNQQMFVFYFVDGGNTGQPVLSFTNGAGSATARVTFNVTGPGTPTVTVDGGSAGVWTTTAGQTYLELLGPFTPSAFNAPAGSQSGIVFQAAAPGITPGSSFWWVQLVQDTITVLSQNGYTTQYSTAPSIPLLDNAYPYQKTTTSAQASTPNELDLAVDVPAVQLNSAYGEEARNFSATMYLMWMPPEGACCSGPGCPIPVPLGTITWGYAGDAINTWSPQNNKGDGTSSNGWVIQSCTTPPPPYVKGNYQPSFVPASSFPTWSGAATNNNLASAANTN
jgi:hypothetical protein